MGWLVPENGPAGLLTAAGGGCLGGDHWGPLGLSALSALEGQLEAGAPPARFVARQSWKGEWVDEGVSPLSACFGQEVPLALLALIWGAPLKPWSGEALDALAAGVDERAWGALDRAVAVMESQSPSQGSRQAWVEGLRLRARGGAPGRRPSLRV